MTDLKFEDLSKKTVAQLRKIAEGTEHQALQDPAKMPKQELLTALCQALGIEAGEPPEESVKDQEPPTQKSKDKPAKKSAKDQKPPPQEPALPASVNKDKSKFKVQIRELKSQRDAALEAHDHVQLKAIRRRIRSLKRKVRRIAV